MTTTPKYRNVTELRNLLKNANIRVSAKANRDDLVRDCLEHGLISYIDSLAVRSPTESRQKVIIDALSRRGCILRDDSRLCQAYIRHGRGDPEEIADVMMEMKFYFEETAYDAIRERLFEETRDECYYNGFHFRDVWNPEQASIDAKHEALEKWVRHHGIQNAIAHPKLPPTLKLQLIKEERMNDIKKIHNFDNEAWKIVQNLLHEWLSRPHLSQPNELTEKVVYDAIESGCIFVKKRETRRKKFKSLEELAKRHKVVGTFRYFANHNIAMLKSLSEDELDEFDVLTLAKKLKFDEMFERAKFINEWLASFTNNVLHHPIVREIVKEVCKWNDNRITLYHLESEFGVWIAHVLREQPTILTKKHNNKTFICNECGFICGAGAVLKHGKYDHGLDVVHAFPTNWNVPIVRMLQARKSIAILRIQRAFREHLYSPNHEFGRRFMLAAANTWGMRS